MTTGFAGASVLVTQTQEEEKEDSDSHATVPLSTCNEYLDSSDDDEDCDASLKAKTPTKYKTYRDLGWMAWEHGDAEYLYTEEEVDDALWALADKEFGGKKENGVFWVVGPKRQTKLKKYQKYHCAFYNCCSCLTEVQSVYSKEEGRYWIEITSKVPHDHVMKKKSHGPLKSALVACIDSPSKLKVAPKALVGRASIKMGQTFTQDQQVALKHAIGRRRILYTTKDLKNGGNGSYYGDVVESLLNKYHRDNIGDSFTRDTVFLVGGRVNVDEVVDNKALDGVQFYCVLSTENLLLNGPRQVMSGQQIILAVDGSYRYVIERDHGLFVVKGLETKYARKNIRMPTTSQQWRATRPADFGAHYYKIRNQI